MGHQDVYSSGNNAIVSYRHQPGSGAPLAAKLRAVKHLCQAWVSASSGSCRHGWQDWGWEDAEAPRDLGDVIFADVKPKETIFLMSLHYFCPRMCFAWGSCAHEIGQGLLSVHPSPQCSGWEGLRMTLSIPADFWKGHAWKSSCLGTFVLLLCDSTSHILMGRTTVVPTTSGRAEGWGHSSHVLPSLPSKSDPFYLLQYTINIIKFILYYNIIVNIIINII